MPFKIKVVKAQTKQIKKNKQRAITVTGEPAMYHNNLSEQLLHFILVLRLMQFRLG